MVKRETKRFDPVGRCIYCGTDERPLSQEHIIAYGLGGNAILPEASCDKCAKITTKIEGHCLGGMLWNFRVRLGIQSRRPRPSTLPLRIEAHDGTIETNYVPAGEYPGILPLPHYPEPGILADRNATPRSMVRVWFATDLKNREEIQNVATSRGGKTWLISSFRPVRFSQMLAKIAHAHAVAVHGLSIFDEFTPLLPAIILDEPNDPCYLIGCSPELPPATGTRMHRVESLSCTTEQHEYLVMAVRLFADLGTPQYYAVAGVKDADPATQK